MSTLPHSPIVEREVGEQTHCHGCKKILGESNALGLGDYLWHADCFRCNTCGVPLNLHSEPSLFGAGTLICDGCTDDCSACGNRIENIVIFAGRQTYCVDCFRCRRCQRKIERLLYARTSGDIFCMECHNILIARRRRRSFRYLLPTPSETPRLDLSKRAFRSSPSIQPLPNLDGLVIVPSAQKRRLASLWTSLADEASMGVDEDFGIPFQISSLLSAPRVEVQPLELATASLHTASKNDSGASSPTRYLEERLVSDSGYATGEHHSSKSLASTSRGLMSEKLIDRDDDNDNDDGGKSDNNTAETVYSALSANGLSPTDTYISQMTSVLFDEIKSFSRDRAVLEKVYQQLPDLLAAFALRLGHQPLAPLAYQTSAFIYKHRWRIQKIFAEIAMPNEIQDDDPCKTEAYEPKDNYAIQRYLEDPERPSAEPNDFVPPSPVLEENDALPIDQQPVSEMIPEIHPYRSLLLQSTAFTWLLGNMRREAILTRASPDVMKQIRAQILCALPPPRIVSRRTPSATHQVILTADWDPSAFMNEQQFPINETTAIERTVTLTGSTTDAQALTTVDYMEQTWPNTGRHILRLVSGAMYLKSSRHTLLPDGTSVILNFEKRLKVNVEGTVDTIVEIAQQIAWLSSALRTSMDSTGITTCTPYVWCEESIRMSGFDVTAFSFSYVTTNIGERSATDGKCWQFMFSNPVLVTGFPIRARSCFNVGLEMPLNLLPLFTGSNRVTHFNGYTCIKGFSAMLVATAVVGKILVWHYICQNESNYLSYLDYNGPELLVSFQQIETSRHIVGWCSDCQYRAGAADAHYDIRGTHLPSPHAGCLLEKVTISGGQCITVGASVVLGVKDLGPHLKREGYIDTLSAIAKRYVVLWDESTKCGWLVNGASALLHLVRAWLYSKDSHMDEQLFDAKKLKSSPHTSDGALKVLTDHQNRQLPLYIDRTERFDEIVIDKDGQASLVQKEKRTYYLFEDLVRRFASILEQMFAHQQQLGGKHGVELKARIRRHLEGWDFAELVSSRDPTPRVATLHALGYGWVDFIRTINAITLFGFGFGDIMRPVDNQTVCQSWKTLPPLRYYLAASISDLKEIVHWQGMIGRHIQLVQGLIWHAPQDLLDECACKKSGGVSSHCDPVQALYPKHSKLVITLRSPEAMLNEKRFERGAVVFGHNVVFPYRWKHRGQDGLEVGSPDAMPLEQAEDLNQQVSTEVSADTRSDESAALSLSLLPTISTPLESNEGRSSDRSRPTDAGPRLPTLTPPSSVNEPTLVRSQIAPSDGEHELSLNTPTSQAKPLPEGSRRSKILGIFTRKSWHVIRTR